jgi:cobalt-zinc-cadmium efflux system outer membrane protein
LSGIKEFTKEPGKPGSKSSRVPENPIQAEESSYFPSGGKFSMRTSYFTLACVVFVGGCSHVPFSGFRAAPVDNRPPISISVPLAQQPAPPPVEPQLQGEHPVDFYVQVALQRNPEILARERGVEARAQVVPQVTSLPDPMLTDTIYPISDNSVQTAAGRVTNSLTLSQKFPWFGKLKLRGEIADRETKIALTQLAETQLKVIEAVKLSYYDIYFNQQAMKITKDSEKALRILFIPLAEARIRTGGSQQDVLRAQVELNKVQDQLILLDRQLKMTQADLAKLLATSPRADLKVASLPDLPPLPQELDDLYKVAVAYRPDLQGKLEAVFRDQRKTDLAQLEYFPDVTVGVSWNAITTADALAGVANGNDAVGMLFSVNLPIWKDRLRAGVLEAENRVAESARMYEAARDDTFRFIRKFTVQAQTLEEQINLFRNELIPKADQTLKVSYQDYRVGKLDALQVIDNWLQLLRFRVQLVRLETSLGQTLASLERVVGSQLTTPPNAAPQPGACLGVPVPIAPPLQTPQLQNGNPALLPQPKLLPGGM